MCGIAGYLLRNGGAREDVVRSMCAQIRHRGPDDEGVLIDGGCGIGMRRLSIIDLSTGHQPVSNEDESVWVVFNGEIYNYQELRADLIRRGHRFATNSDTETLVHLYEEKGAEGLASLRGMFAFCIWDSRKRKILLARDRFGKKPLYYAALPGGLYFASELKCLRVAGVPLDEDREALRLYFQFGYIPDPFTAFRAVRKLMPGCWLEYDMDGRTSHGRYWRMPAFTPGAPERMGKAETCVQLRNGFDEAVRMRMIADVPLGAFLSGGIDSSLIVASMARQSSAPVKTFSIGFEEAAYNELEYAAMVARQYGTDHHEIMVRPDSVDLITKLAWHFDEPFADSSAIPTYVVSEFAARHVKVALSGDGGDEFFGGYDTLGNVEKFQSLDRVPRALRKLAWWTASALPYSAYGKNRLRVIGAASALDRYFESNYTSYFLRKRMLRPDWMLPPGSAYLRQILPDSFPSGAGASACQPRPGDADGGESVAGAVACQRACQPRPGDADGGESGAGAVACQRACQPRPGDADGGESGAGASACQHACQPRPGDADGGESGAGASACQPRPGDAYGGESGAGASACQPSPSPDDSDIMAQAQYFEAAANLTGDMLVKVDRASMAASLEVRCPMLDHEFAQFAAAIPLSWKRRGGKGKRILLEALGDRLPPALLTRPKMGFGVPLDRWFRGPLRELTWDTLTGKRFLERGIVEPGFVRYLLEEHASGRRGNQHQIYGLLMLELWRRNLEEPAHVPESLAPCVALGK
jgi:asparagine synthase (glutamine-hydrolysing)